MTFSLAALHGFVRYRSAEGAARWRAYLGALVALVAALLTKVVAVVVPAALLLLDACDATRRRRRWLLDKAPFAAAAAAFVLVTLQTQDVAIAEGRRAFWMDGPTTVFTMVPVLARYVGMVLWPAGLSAVYAPEIRESADAAFWGAGLLLCAVAAGGVVLWRRRREAVAPLAFFFVALLPVMHIVPLPTLMNDRYLYFPMLGAAALGGIALERLAAEAPRVRRIALAAAVVVAVALAAASSVRTGVWRDDLTLWRDVTEKTPGSPFAWMQLGVALVDAERLADAVAAYERALRVDPLYAPVLNNLGALYSRLGRPGDAQPLLRKAVEQAPGFFEARMNLGVVEAMRGDLAGAERAFAAAVALRPDDPLARTALEDVRRAALAR
jgi:Flp pilus assembly protein TadD